MSKQNTAIFVIIILAMLALLVGLAYGQDKDEEKQVILWGESNPVFNDDAPCCTKECIEYLIPSGWKYAIYMDCTDCERCLYERIINQFNRR